MNFIKHKQSPYYKIDFYYPVSSSQQVSILSSRLSGDTRKSLRHCTRDHADDSLTWKQGMVVKTVQKSQKITQEFFKKYPKKE